MAGNQSRGDNIQHDVDCVMVNRLVKCPRKIPAINILKAQSILKIVQVNLDQNAVRKLKEPMHTLELFRAYRVIIWAQIDEAKKECKCPMTKRVIWIPPPPASTVKIDSKETKIANNKSSAVQQNNNLPSRPGPIIKTTAGPPIFIDLEAEEQFDSLKSPERGEETTTTMDTGSTGTDGASGCSCFQCCKDVKPRKRRFTEISLQPQASTSSSSLTETQVGIVAIKADGSNKENEKIEETLKINPSAEEIAMNQMDIAEIVIPSSDHQKAEDKEIKETPKLEPSSEEAASNQLDVVEMPLSSLIQSSSNDQKAEDGTKAEEDKKEDAESIAARAVFRAMMQNQHPGPGPNGETACLSMRQLCRISTAVNMLGQTKEGQLRALIGDKEEREEKPHVGPSCVETEFDIFASPCFDWISYVKQSVAEIKLYNANNTSDASDNDNSVPPS